MESGLVGKITKIIDDSYMNVEIAEGVEVKCVRHSVSVILKDDKKETKKTEKASK